MSPSEANSASARNTTIVGDVGKLVNIAKVEGNIYFNDISAFHSQQEELISLLDHRRDNILRLMEEAQTEAVGSFRQGLGRPDSRPDSEESLVSHLNAIKLLFLELHEKNITAIRKGQLALSHELTAEIHALLWIRRRNTFWGAFAESGVAYSVNFGSDQEYCELYPSFFVGAETVQQSYPVTEIGGERLKEIEKQIEQRDPLAEVREQKAEAARREAGEAAMRAYREDIEQLEQFDREHPVMKATLRPDGWVKCPFCGKNFSSRSSSWDSGRHRSCRQRLDLV